MDLRTYLQTQDGPLLLDGGMGTQLDARGAEMGGLTCLSAPEIVLDVHQAYVDAGAMLLITNTLTMNRVYIEAHNLDIDVREVNLAGAKLAQQAAVSGQFVLGDISSTSKMLAPLGDLTEDQAFTSYHEQACILAEGGVDGFIIETMFDLNETLIALKACKQAADLPVFVSMTFETLKHGGRTIMGNSAEDCAKALAEAGADVIGANCGSLTPLEMAEIVKIMSDSVDVPIAVQPNAGKPRLEGGETVFDMSPTDFAEGIASCIQNGARLVGGCCGTSPEHIRAITE
jgi:5-methyltetrahydrofolate--homocysteine methyltransferase